LATIYTNGFEWNSIHETPVRGGDSHDYFILSTSPTPRSGSYCVRLYNYLDYTDRQGMRVYLSTALDELYIQFAFACDNLPEDRRLCYWMDTAGDLLGELWVTDANLRLAIGGSTVATGSRVCSTGAVWHCVELHILIDNSSGKVTCKVDGLVDFDYTGDTQPGATDTVKSIGWGSWNYLENLYMDDIIINDTTGSFNNSWPGCLSLILLLPSGAGTFTNFTPTSGSNYQCVDEVPPSSTDYVYAKSSGLTDSYTFQNLPAGASTVCVLNQSIWAKKAEAVDTYLCPILVQGITITAGTSMQIDMGYTLKQNFWQYNPITGGVFTQEEVDSIEGGFASFVPSE